MPLAEYRMIGPGKLAAHLPPGLVQVLEVARDIRTSVPGLPGPGPLATASRELSAKDPLAPMEAQFVADDLGAIIGAARAEQNDLVDRVIAAATPAGVTAALTGDQVLVLSSWVNGAYVAVQSASRDDVHVGEGQGVFDDDMLAALMGGDDEPAEVEIDLLPAALNIFATELLMVHHQLRTAQA